MTGTSVPLGPFSGGLNQVDDPKLIGDNELTVCQNLDINPDGELVIRSPLKLQSGGAIYSVAGTGPNQHYLVGVALQNDNVNRLFAYSESDGYLYYGLGSGFGTPYNRQNSWDPTSMGQPNKSVQYNGFEWFVPRSPSFSGATTVSGFSSDLTPGTNAGSAISTMPRGSGAVVHKDRMFIFGPVDTNAYQTSYRVYYSAATNFASWPALNFFDINPGDGEGVTAAYATTDSIIFFKRHSIYILTFDTDPGLGTLRRLDSSVGCTGPDAVTFYQGNIYFIDDGSIYRIAAYNVVEIGRKLGLKTLRTTTTKTARTQDFAYVLGSRILFAVHNGVQYYYYVYHTEAGGAFSQYIFTEQPDRFFRVLNPTHTEEMVASKYGTAKIYRMQPFGITENSSTDLGDYPTNLLPVALTTKTFNMSNYENFKRMFWWAAELYSNTGFRMEAWHNDGTFVGRSRKDFTFGTSTSTAFVRSPAAKRARWYQFTIDTSQNATANPFFRLLSLVVNIGMKDKVNAAYTG